ncbi:hypothetical protein, partial [Salmonella sp. s58078]|uniref:hypothetical protein n=1 Tax=Salmonella sp. s58078 TaxID=3159699 RepID=UPI003980ECAB
ENKGGTERENHLSPGEKVKDKAKSVLKDAEKSAHKIKHSLSGKGSKKFRNDSNSVEAGSVSSEEGSVTLSVSTSGVEGLHVVSKPKTISGSESPRSELNGQVAISEPVNGHVAISEPASNVEDP